MKIAHVALMITLAGFAAGNLHADADSARGELHPEFDEEVREVLDLARAGEWERAQERASSLRNESPEDPRLRRLDGWVQRERLRQADRRLERELSDIAEPDPRFAPTLRDVFLEPFTTPRRLPMSPDLREAIEREEERRLIPETYGQVRQQRPQASEELLQRLDQRIDLDLEGATIHEALLALREATGINLAVHGRVQALDERVTLHVNDVRAAAILEYLAQNHPIRFTLREDIIWVRSPLMG